METLTKKKQTKKDILEAITKLSQVKGNIITLKKIADIVGCVPQNLRKNYFDFIRKNCDELHYHKKPGGDLDNSDTISYNERIKRLNPDLPDKAWGVGLVNHNTYRR